MVLVFLDQADGHIKKSSFEAASYGAKVAEMMCTTAEAILLGTVSDDLASIGTYGIKKYLMLQMPHSITWMHRYIRRSLHRLLMLPAQM